MFKPPGLHTDKPAGLLPGEDGFPSGPGARAAQHETGTVFQSPLHTCVVFFV